MMILNAFLVARMAFGVVTNRTINELFNYHRYDYMKHPQSGKFYNPFDRGCIGNCAEFWL